MRPVGREDQEAAMGRVEGKVILIAGAGGGIGGAGAEGLGREGAAVVCADIDASAAAATANHIEVAGGRATALGLDVRDRPAVDAAVAAAVREFGRLDVLLDCAGVSQTASFTSQLAEVARPERAAYVASKGGGRSLTHAMALELAPHGIRVNAIAPGPTLTGLTRASYADPERRRATIAQIPLGRMGKPDDIVGAILYLASDESRWVTGSTVTVDGGYLVQ